MNEKERICRLAATGDLVAFRRLIVLRKRDPGDPEMQTAHARGWLILRNALLETQNLLLEDLPPRKFRVEAYYEMLGLQAPGLWAEAMLAKWEEEGLEEWVIDRTPRRTGRTTRMLLEVLCAIEEGTPSVCIATTQGQMHEVRARFHEMASTLGIPVSICDVRFVDGNNQSALRGLSESQVWRDHYLSDQAYYRMRDRLQRLNPDNMHGAADGFGGSDY